MGFKDHFGVYLWEYLSSPENTRQGQEFAASMTSYGAAAVNALLLEYDLVGEEVLCDVGGGRGALLAGFKEQWPNTTLLLLDLAAPVVSPKPRVFCREALISHHVGVRSYDFVFRTFFEPTSDDQERAREDFAERGVNITAFAESFFDPLPSAFSQCDVVSASWSL